MKWRWSNGKHAYRGKRNSRAQRQFSKLGVERVDLSEVFKKLDKEKLIVKSKR